MNFSPGQRTLMTSLPWTMPPRPHLQLTFQSVSGWRRLDNFFKSGKISQQLQLPLNVLLTSCHNESCSDKGGGEGRREYGAREGWEN